LKLSKKETNPTRTHLNVFTERTTKNAESTKKKSSFGHQNTSFD